MLSIIESVFDCVKLKILVTYFTKCAVKNESNALSIKVYFYFHAKPIFSVLCLFIIFTKVVFYFVYWMRKTEDDHKIW